MSKCENTITGAERFGILLIDGYPLIPFSCLLETLRTANRLSGEKLFDWEFFAPGCDSVVSNSGIRVPTVPLRNADDIDTLVICAPDNAHEFNDAATIRILQEVDARGARLGTVSFGSFILARAGLLEQDRSTVHWEHIPLFKEWYPQLDVAFSLYEISDNRFTCSGGTAALDMMLTLIENRHGRALATEISQYFHHDRIRTELDSQLMAGRLDLAMSAPKLIDVIRLMEANIEEPLALPDIAERCKLSLRQMERLFHKYRETTPTRYYLSLRLAHARQLLLNTSYSIIEISIATGFPSPSYFTSCYRRSFGSTPRKDRMRAAQGRRL